MRFFMIGIAVLSPCVMVAVAESPQEAVRWDFEDAAVGKLPKGWSAAKTGEGEGSVWKVVEDASAPQRHEGLGSDLRKSRSDVQPVRGA